MEDLIDFETVVFSSFPGLIILVEKIALFYEIIGGGVEQPLPLNVYFRHK